MLRQAHTAMVSRSVDADLALAALAAIEPFEYHPEIVAILKEELERGC